MTQPPTYPPLEPEDEAYLERAREWVKGHFTEDADEKLAPVDGKLRVLDAILEAGWVEARERLKLESLGVVFGDALVQELMLDWVIVDDEYGRTPAVNWPGTSALAYPISMIAKRVEAGDTVDVYDLFEGICGYLRDAAFSGRYV